MKCTVRRAAKNLRYRILTINGENYILDMGGASLGKMLFPFFYWLLPNRVYKINDPDSAEELKASTVKHKESSSPYGWIAAASIILGNLLSPLINQFDIASPARVNRIILIIIFMLVILLIGFLNRMFKRRLKEVIDPQELSKGLLWVMPVPFKFVFLVIFMYFVPLAFVVFGIASYIEHGNWFILLMTTVSLFITLVVPSLTTIVEGNTRVIFLDGKKADIFPQKKS